MSGISIHNPTKVLASFINDTYINTKQNLFYGMNITLEKGQAPLKIPTPHQSITLPSTNTWREHLQDSLNTHHSLHDVYDFQREVLNVAATIFDKSDPVIKSMSNQMELAKIKEDRPATKQELAAAKELKNNIIDLIAKRFQQLNNIPTKEAQAAAIGTYRQARVSYINSQPWQTIKNNISYNQTLYSSTQLPAAEMKNGKQNIFAKSYEGKGVCSWDTLNTHHATNLWQSTLNTTENGQTKTLFSGIRHGIISPYHIKDPALRQIGAENRAKEVISAALYSKPELLEQALKGETVNLKIISTGLLTATNIIGKEKNMVDDQMQAWRALSQPGKTLQLSIKNEQGKLQTVKIKPEIAAFNFGVNEMALKLGFGHRVSDNYNAAALQQLFGNDLRPDAKPSGWVGEYLNRNPDNAETVITLSRQVKEIWENKLHHKDSGEPYKAAQRIAMLANEINSVPCWNCKSGKDRTGMLDAEIKREAISIHQGISPSIPGSTPDSEGQKIFQKVLLNSGNMEIQAQNTGSAGNKVMKNIVFSPLNLSYQSRIGDPDVWQSVKGLSSLLIY
ncbi:type III secretion system effector inositol phosphate phosphatase [Obesumbacterium proteus]|uniref:type III secretion system effector inositol phosphate phosphatase n=1 Tax=Obesumbacterium proteus TaxID=82983 RepID=UPI00242EDC0B|nr:type III secretion system effector inositol phosphate phosphatase [Obesumbacterium proteus]